MTAVETGWWYGLMPTRTEDIIVRTQPFHTIAREDLPPLQMMSFEVTSWIGWKASVSQTEQCEDEPPEASTHSVVVRRTDTGELALINAVHIELLENSVSRG